MNDFLAVHGSKIKGVLGCFDRMLFRGYLPIQDGRAMAEFLRSTGVRYQTLKGFLTEHGDRDKNQARKMAKEA